MGSRVGREVGVEGRGFLEDFGGLGVIFGRLVRFCVGYVVGV